MKFSNEFNEWLLDKISDALDDYIGIKIRGCDLAFKLFENEILYGSTINDADELREFINEYFEDAGKIIEWIKENRSKELPNLFDDLEEFYTNMLLIGAHTIIDDSAFICEQWTNKFELTKASIAIIKNDIGINTVRPDRV